MKTKEFLINYLDKNIKEYFILDIETTGLDSKFDEIIEVGVIIVNNNEITEKFHSYVKTNNLLSEFIKNLTKIDDDKLKNGLEISKVIIKIEKFIPKNSIIIAHNFSFDKTFLRNANMGVDKYNWVDSINIFKIAYPKLKNYKLSTIVKKYAKTNQFSDSSHNAIADVYNLQEALVNSLKKLSKTKIEKFKYANNVEIKNSNVKKTYNLKKKEAKKYFKNKSVAFTGSLKVSRASLIKKINELGGFAHKNLTKTTDFIIVGENSGSKLEKAKKWDIKIISEKELDQILTNGKK